MSVNLPSHYTMQFASNIDLLLQQKGSKLRNYVMSGSHVGKQVSPVNQIASIAALRRTTRFGAMGRVDAAVDRRWVYPVSYDLPQLVDNFDLVRTIEDPKSKFVENAVNAMGRAMDDTIIDALFGDAKTGEQGATTTSFPSGNIIVHGSAGLTVLKLLQAKRMLMAAEVDVDNDPLVCVVTAKQHENLLNETKIISVDYNVRPTLVDGKVDQFLGIKFVHCERLDALTTTRYVPLFAKSGMYLGLWEDIKTNVGQRNDIEGLPWQVYAEGTFGATRLEENKVIKIECTET